MMRPYLLLLLCCFSHNLSGQPAPASGTGFTTEDMTFSSAGISLAGTVFKPEHPHAAVVLVHGSGQEARMTSLASLLAGNGIAVFTYDKRGVGRSGGIYAGPEVGTNNIDSANLSLLALDASAAADALMAHLPGSRVPLGLLGFSQAGWVIPMAAERNPRLNFMVLFSAPLVTTLEQLRFQFYTNGDAAFWETHTEEEAREHVRNDPDRYQFAATDPREALSRLRRVRGLWLFGGKDIQIPVGLCIEHLDALKAKDKQYEYRLFPELGHNTAFADSKEPVNLAIQWIKARGSGLRQK